MLCNIISYIAEYCFRSMLYRRIKHSKPLCTKAAAGNGLLNKSF